MTDYYDYYSILVGTTRGITSVRLITHRKHLFILSFAHLKCEASLHIVHVGLFIFFLN